MYINTSNNLGLGLSSKAARQAESKKANSNKKKSLGNLPLAVVGIAATVGFNINKMALPSFPRAASNSPDTCRIIASDQISQPLQGYSITLNTTITNCIDQAKAALHRLCKQEDAKPPITQITGLYGESQSVIYREQCPKAQKTPSN